MLDRTNGCSTLKLGQMGRRGSDREWIAMGDIPDDAQLVLCFGPTAVIEDPRLAATLSARFPSAEICGCSTGHTITTTCTCDDAVAAVAMRFEHTGVRVAVEPLEGPEDSAGCGARLAEKLRSPDLRLVLILSEGLHVNGDALIRGVSALLPDEVGIVGGLAGDGASFARTVVLAGGSAAPGRVAAIGFYGDALRFRHGWAGGWNVFGPERIITAAEGPVLFGIDGKPALDLYERYLGEEADGLPGSALLYPLQIWEPGSDKPPVVRTVLGIDTDARSMTFAGDIPVGWHAQLMVGHEESLVDGARTAGQRARVGNGNAPLPEGGVLAFLVSCVGRQLCLRQNTPEEIEAIRSESTDDTLLTGFYSYGEISSHGGARGSGLLNQSMAVTYIWEEV